jgi:hypothetical protein
MEVMGLPKSYSAAWYSASIQAASIANLNQNSTEGVYTGNEAQQASAQKNLDNTSKPQAWRPLLTLEIAFVQTGPVRRPDFRPAWGAILPPISRKNRFQHRPSTPVYTEKWRKTRRRKRISGKNRQIASSEGAKDHRDQILNHVSIDEHPKIVEEKSRAGWIGGGYPKKYR